MAITVNDQKNDDNMVENIIRFKQYVDELLKDVFVDVSPTPILGPLSGTANNPMSVDGPPPPKVPNRKWIEAVRDSFSLGFKERKNKPAEMIAKYLDQKMRKGQLKQTEKDYERELDEVLSLTRFTEDKDVFRTFYMKALAKRLLLEKSASDAFEKTMLKKLQNGKPTLQSRSPNEMLIGVVITDYDPEFSIGDQMFKDMALSRDLMKEYTHRRERNGANSNMKLNAIALQRGTWPFTAKSYNVILPNDVRLGSSEVEIVAN